MGHLSFIAYQTTCDISVHNTSYRQLKKNKKKFKLDWPKVEREILSWSGQACVWIVSFLTSTVDQSLFGYLFEIITGDVNGDILGLLKALQAPL